MKNILMLLGFCVLGTLAGMAAMYGYSKLSGDDTQLQVAHGDFSSHYTQAGSQVILFGTSTCPYCKQAREFFAANKTRYRDYVIDKDETAQSRFQGIQGKYSIQSVPVVLIGDTLVVGFDKDRYMDELRRAKLAGL